jgi:hypothetical protein
MPADFKGFLNEQTERGKGLVAIFGKPEVFLKSFIPERVSWNGEVKNAYMIDLAMYPAEVIDRLANHLSQRFNIPVAEVKKDLPRIGCPLLTDDVSIMIENPQRFIDLEDDCEEGDADIEIEEEDEGW